MTLPQGFLVRPFAHRGLHGSGRSENSLDSVRAALEGGFAIEIDVQPSRDGVAMVFHDATLDRMTDETGPIVARDAAALTRIALPDGGTVPRLSEVLDCIAGRVPLVIEIKDQSGRLLGTTGTLEASVAKALAGYDGPVAIMSFNPDTVACMAELAPNVPRGLTTCAFSPEIWDLPPDRLGALREIRDFDRTGASFVSHEAADLARPRVAGLRADGAGVLCWTIRSSAEAARALRHADQITFEAFRPA